MDIKPVAWLEESGRMVLRAARVRTNGFMQYGGDAEHICKSIVEECWNGKYFRTSTGHFTSFFSRDFGWCARALCSLGHRDKVLKTLEYALSAFERAGRVATTITPRGRVLDVFSYGPDSLAFLLHALHEADAKSLVETYREFLQEEVQRCCNLVWDRKTKLVRADTSFTSIKDNASRKSCVYDNAMVGLISKHLDSLGLQNPWAGEDFSRKLIDNFWTGSYFREDLSGSDVVAGDANIFPFWTGIVQDKTILRKAIAAVRKEGLDKPLPLRYTMRIPKGLFLPAQVFTPNYEGNTVWAHLGLLYIEVVARLNKRWAKEYLAEYTKRIEKYRTFLELYEPDGTPYRTLAYVADEGMLWAANYLMLAKNLRL